MTSLVLISHFLYFLPIKDSPASSKVLSFSCNYNLHIMHLKYNAGNHELSRRSMVPGSLLKLLRDADAYQMLLIFQNLFKKIDWSGIRTHAPEEIGALIQRLRPLGHPVVTSTLLCLIKNSLSVVAKISRFSSLSSSRFHTFKNNPFLRF